MKDQIRVLKAAKKCNLKAYQSKTMSGERCVKLTYNKFGDSFLFNPLEDIGQAMNMLIKLDGSLIINKDDSNCVIYIKQRGGSEVSAIGIWKSNNKNKIKNICNAIVNCILMVKNENT